MNVCEQKPDGRRLFERPAWRLGLLYRVELAERALQSDSARRKAASTSPTPLVEPGPRQRPSGLTLEAMRWKRGRGLVSSRPSTPHHVACTAVGAWRVTCAGFGPPVPSFAAAGSGWLNPHTAETAQASCIRMLALRTSCGPASV